MPDTEVERVIASIRADIFAGRLRPGDKLPSISQLAEQHGVGVTTIKTAQTALKAMGVLRAEHGRGVYVV